MKSKISRGAVASFGLGLFFTMTSLVGATEDLKVWHHQPAKNWNEATPIGNGRLAR